MASCPSLQTCSQHGLRSLNRLIAICMRHIDHVGREEAKRRSLQTPFQPLPKEVVAALWQIVSQSWYLVLQCTGVVKSPKDRHLAVVRAEDRFDDQERTSIRTNIK